MDTILTIATDNCGNWIALDASGAELARVEGGDAEDPQVYVDDLVKLVRTAATEQAACYM